ncbi:pro-neuregulin-2, membrane-bound isoform-like [Saccoglossus kowalevskii]
MAQERVTFEQLNSTDDLTTTTTIIDESSKKSDHYSQCEKKAAEEFCLNGGTCRYLPELGENSCRCTRGYTGVRCSDWIPDKYLSDLLEDELMDTALGLAVAVTTLIPMGGVTAYAYYNTNIRSQIENEYRATHLYAPGN